MSNFYSHPGIAGGLPKGNYDGLPSAQVINTRNRSCKYSLKLIIYKKILQELAGVETDNAGIQEEDKH